MRASNRILTLGEADKQVVQYTGAGENSYRSSAVRPLAGLAAYPWALECLVGPPSPEAHISRSMLAPMLISLLMVPGCDGSPSSTPDVRPDTATVLRAALEYLLESHTAILLERRLLPADSFNVLPPYSKPHAEIPVSALITSASANMIGVNLFDPGPSPPDSATIVSLSTATIEADRAFVWAVTSTFDPRWGYSAYFQRLRMDRDQARGWKVVAAPVVGYEN